MPGVHSLMVYDARLLLCCAIVPCVVAGATPGVRVILERQGKPSSMREPFQIWGMPRNWWCGRPGPRGFPLDPLLARRIRSYRWRLRGTARRDTMRGSRRELGMAEMSSRNGMQGLAGLSAAVRLSAESASTPMRKTRDPRRRGMQFAELFSVGEDHKIRLAAQVGITHAIVSTSSTLSQLPREKYVEGLRKIKAGLNAAGDRKSVV